MKRSLITPEIRAAFRARLQALDIDAVEEIAGGLEDLGGFLDDDESLKFRDLPKELPVDIRRRLVALSVQYIELHNLMATTLADLTTDAGAMFEKKHDEAEASLPHCQTCGQKVPLKKAGRRGR